MKNSLGRRKKELYPFAGEEYSYFSELEDVNSLLSLKSD